MAAGRKKPNVGGVSGREDAPPGGTPLAFRYQVTSERTVFVFWRSRRVLTVSGRDAEQLLARLEGLDSDGRQMVLAKATGNFKRGNERR